jgi:drug/metabolite transporter (DMT)-like permease
MIFKQSRSMPSLMLFLAAFFWGIAIPIMKILGHEQNLVAPEIGSISGAAASLAVRFGGAALFIAIAFRISIPKILPIEWINGGVLGLITAISMWLQVDGLNYTSASTAGFLIAMYSVFVPLISWISGRRKMTALLALCCLLVILGMATLTGMDPRSLSLGRGEWENLAAAALFAIQILWVDRFKIGTYSPGRLTLVLCITVAAFCTLALFFMPGGLSAIPATHASLRAGLLTLFLCLFGTTFPFLIMNKFQAEVSPITAGFIYCFEPIATSLGALFLPELLIRVGGVYTNESISIRLAIGGTLVLAANLILLLDRPKPTAV